MPYESTVIWWSCHPLKQLPINTSRRHKATSVFIGGHAYVLTMTRLLQFWCQLFPDKNMYMKRKAKKKKGDNWFITMSSSQYIYIYIFFFFSCDRNCAAYGSLNVRGYCFHDMGDIIIAGSSSGRRTYRHAEAIMFLPDQRLHKVLLQSVKFFMCNLTNKPTINNGQGWAHNLLDRGKTWTTWQLLKIKPKHLVHALVAPPHGDMNNKNI